MGHENIVFGELLSRFREDPIIENALVHLHLALLYLLYKVLLDELLLLKPSLEIPRSVRDVLEISFQNADLTKLEASMKFVKNFL